MLSAPLPASQFSLRPARSSRQAQSQAPQQRLGAPAITPVAVAPTARAAPLNEFAHKQRINAWTVGLAAGRTEGAPLQFAAELARVLDDGDNMRVLPIVTRGPFDNVYDLLYLRGVDAAIVYGDVLDHFKNKPEFAGAWRRINYLLSLFPSEVHVFVRPEINSLQDLAGKVVNFNTAGTAANFSGPIIFKQLGIDVKATFVPHNVAMEKMRQGPEVAATFWVSSKPLAPFLKGKWPEGFKFLPVEYSDKLEYYTPAYLEHADYPALIPKGQQIATISVPAVLAVYDWPKNSERYHRLARLVDYLFGKVREAAERARLPREMEGREPRRQGAGLEEVPAAAGQARQGARRIRTAQPRADATATALGAEVMVGHVEPLDFASRSINRRHARRHGPAARWVIHRKRKFTPTRTVCPSSLAGMPK